MRATWGYKSQLFSLYALAYVLLYVLPNMRPFFEPVYLSLWALDESVPLIPWTFVVYISDYILVMSVVFILKDRSDFNSLGRLVFTGFLICGLFFILYPTRYPRPVYPQVDNPLVAFAMGLISNLDKPNNCFPSNHVVMTGLAVWSLRKRTRLFFWYTLWATAIFLSTLTTKQHYFIDVLGGIGIVGLVAWLEYRVFSKVVTVEESHVL